VERKPTRLRRAAGIFAAALVAAAVLVSSASALEVRVEGNHLVDASGKTLVLHGVNRSGTEYACQGGYGFFDGPSSKRSIHFMKTWKINAVRLPLNESCWLGINGIDDKYAGDNYRRVIQSYVSKLNGAGLYVIIDLHLAAPADEQAHGIIPMTDADHAPDFWRSVASFFADNHSLIFDLYNEPHGDITWDCWLNGCDVPSGGTGAFNEDHPPYHAAGMQELVDAVRSTGATQPLMAGGLDYSRTLAEWLSHQPVDPLHQLTASEHNYGRLAPCGGGCKKAILAVKQQVPVIVGEVGETDCKTHYIDKWLPWADRHGLSYLGWTWDAVKPGSWTCAGGPSLIENYKGKPTAFGIGFRDHLKELARG
jgi:hypothetical protein